MLEVLYRIYEVLSPSESKSKQESESNSCYSLYDSISKSQNKEIVMDCMICESRDHFKDIIKSNYGDGVGFRYSKKLNSGDLYCIIIGEHCYNAERYFNKSIFTCDFCGAIIEFTYGKVIAIFESDIKYRLYNNMEYKSKRFCSNVCRNAYVNEESAKCQPSDDHEYFVTRDMFTSKIAGYIYKITKKSTGEFYIGKTVYAPMFRWAQHLNSDRFPLSSLDDYTFETLRIVPLSENLSKVEDQYIKEYYNKFPKLSLNKSGVSKDMKKLIKEVSLV